MAAILQHVARGIEQVTGWDTDVLGLAWLEHQLGVQHRRGRLIHSSGELEPVFSGRVISHLQQHWGAGTSLEVNHGRRRIPGLHGADFNGVK